MHVDNEQVLTKIIKAIYKKAEKEHLDKDRVAEVVQLIQYIFHKTPAKRNQECCLCGSRGE
jgi:hypothetical protein